jgi:hypothetical protein
MRRDLRGVFGYRPPSLTEESANLPAVEPSAADLSSAPTVAHSEVPDFGPKQTSDGTELTVPVTMSPRYLGAIIGVAVLALLIGGGAVAFFGRSGVASPGSPGAGASASSAASLAPTDLAAGGAAPLAESSLPALALGAPSGAARRGGAGTRPSAASPVASVRGASPVAPSGAASLVTNPPVTPVTPLTPVTPGVAASAGGGAAAAASAAAPPYDAAGAHVVFGAIAHERVREDVIRRKMSDLAPALSGCYRDALMMAGAAVPGSAEINMSIDGAGNMTSTVRAPKHPSFARCALRVLAGQKVPVSALESGDDGANATQWLELRP